MNESDWLLVTDTRPPSTDAGVNDPVVWAVADSRLANSFSFIRMRNACASPNAD